MKGSADKRARIASGVAGAALVAQLLVLRAVSSANDAFVTLAGTEIHWGCSFKQAFGVPCPNCGMTRSVVFALHGELGRAFGMNPAGPLLVLGALVLAAALLFAAFGGRSGDTASVVSGRLPQRIMLGTAAYGGLVFVVLMVNWVRVLT